MHLTLHLISTRLAATIVNFSITYGLALGPTILPGAASAAECTTATTAYEIELDEAKRLYDCIEAAMIDGTCAADRAPLDLFSFAKGSTEDVRALQRYGSMPWWAVDNLNLSMLRPLASALVHFDRAVFGDNLRAYHAHSFFWWAALVLSVALLLRSLLPTRLAAGAIFLFALNPGHHYTVTWLANRSAFVSLCFGLLGLHARDDHARQPDVGGTRQARHPSVRRYEYGQVSTRAEARATPL